MIFGVLNIVNFAHGSFVMLAMYVTYYAWALAGLDPLYAIPIAFVVLGVIGWITYWGIVQRVMGKSGLAQIVCTFGLLIALEGLAQVLFSPNDRAVSGTKAENFGFRLGAISISGAQLVGFIGAVVFTALLALFMNNTEIGNAIRATGEDRAAASLMGINVRRMDALAWALGLGCTGVAGALLMNSYSVNPTAGVTFGLIAFFAVALGGFGSVVGAGIAGIVLGVAQNVAALYFPQYALVALVGIYLLVVVVRPQGIMGTA